jgi:hypothetical protein
MNKEVLPSASKDKIFLKLKLESCLRWQTGFFYLEIKPFQYGTKKGV